MIPDTERNLRRCFLVALSLLIGLQYLNVDNIQAQTKKILIEDFDSDTLNGLPSRWFNRDGSVATSDLEGDDRLLYRYTIEEENGNQYLSYEGTDAKHLMIPIKDMDFDLRNGPEFSWKWRAHILADDSDVYDRYSNDAVLSVYVVFGLTFFKVPKVIRYVWGNTRAKGQHYSLNFGNQKLLILRDSTDAMGVWVTEKRNLLEDYSTYFSGKPPKTPLAILILSDGNDTKQLVKGDYDDFFIEVKND